VRLGFRRVLLLAGGSLAIAGLMAAYSYSSANINSANGEITVKDTSSALLALTPDNSNGLDKDMVVTTTGGQLTFNFDKGFGGNFGIQPGSTYEWDDLFGVTNNSNNPIKVTVWFGGGVPAQVYGRSPLATGAEVGWIPLGAMSFNLTPGQHSPIDIKIANPSSGYVNWSGNATVTVAATPIP